MKKILYSLIEKDNIDVYKNLIKKIKMDMHCFQSEMDDDAYVIAIDEETKKIVSCIGLNERLNQNIVDVCEYQSDLKNSEEIQLNMKKIVLNYAKSKNFDLEYSCEYWDTFNNLRELGFDIADKEGYNYSMEWRRLDIDELKKIKEKLESSGPEAVPYVTQNIKYLTDKLELFNCNLIMKNENNKAPYLVEGYKTIKEIPSEYLDTINVDFNDPRIFMEDDKYMYCELRKTDDVYEDIKTKIAMEITEPNLRRNGGKLYAYLGLDFPELLVYLRNKNSKEIIGYIGLTENYGKGLYISQIAVKENYRNQGVGSILIEDAIRRANEKGIEVVSADIASDNDLSLALFSKHNFEGDNGNYFVDVSKYIKEHSKKI